MSLTYFPGTFGPDQWHCLEYLADETEAGRVSLERFHGYVVSMSKLLPCSGCRDHLTQNLKIYPLPDTISNARRWVCDVHNSVNRANSVSEVKLEDVDPRDPPLHKQFRLLMIFAGFVQELDEPRDKVFWVYAREALRLFGLCAHGPDTTPVRWVSHQARKIGLHVDDTLFEALDDLEDDLITNFEARVRDRKEILRLRSRLGMPEKLVAVSDQLGQLWQHEDKSMVLLPPGVSAHEVDKRDEHQTIGAFRLAAMDRVLAVADDDRVYVHTEDGLVSPIRKRATCLQVVGRRIFVGTAHGGWIYSRDGLRRFHGDEEVTAIAHDGQAWATRTGVYNHEGLIAPSLDAVDKVTAVHAKRGKVMIGTKEGRVFVLDSLSTLEPLVELDTAHREILGVCLTQEGPVWFDGLWMGGAFRGMSDLIRVNVVEKGMIIDLGVDGPVTVPV